MTDSFGDDDLTAAEALAVEQATEDIQMLKQLVAMRIENNLSQSDVAREMGRDRSAVCRFERLDSDPRLSTVRRYAGAVGALVRHITENTIQPKHIHQGDLIFSTSAPRTAAYEDIGVAGPSRHAEPFFVGHVGTSQYV